MLISTISGGDLLALIVSPATARHPHSTNEIDQAHRHQCHCQTLQATPEPESPADTTEKIDTITDIIEAGNSGACHSPHREALRMPVLTIS